MELISIYSIELNLSDKINMKKKRLIYKMNLISTYCYSWFYIIKSDEI